MAINFIILSQAIAQSENILIGKWRWNSANCTKEDLLFSNNSVVYNVDGDGETTVYTFKKVDYTIRKDEISVNFGEPHGFGKAKSTTQMSFKILDKDHVIMDRKKGMNDLYRCK